MSSKKSRTQRSSCKQRRLHIETLEARSLLAGLIAGDTVRVNEPVFLNQIAPDVGMNAKGESVVVWQSFLSSTNSEIRGQRINRVGEKIGAEFQVSASSLNARAPKVAVAPDGTSMVVFLVGVEIYGQRLDTSGNKQGSPFRIDTRPSGSPGRMIAYAASSDSKGNFGVAYLSEEFVVTDRFRIHARKYDSLGNSVGEEEIISATGYANDVSISMLSNSGAFVAYTTTDFFAAKKYQVIGQFLDTTWNVSGTTFQVGSNTINEKVTLSTAANSHGDIVTTWSSWGQDGDNLGIFAQRLNASGSLLGPEFQVNPSTALEQSHPDVAMDAAGSFVITWFSDDNQTRQIFARQYDSQGSAVTGEMFVTSELAGNTQYPAIAGSSDGNFSVAWHSMPTGGNYSEIFLRNYTSSGWDFGDAPASYGSYLINNGARHLAQGPKLGLARDTEIDAINPYWLGDLDGLADDRIDALSIDDEDGVSFNTTLVTFANSDVTSSVLVTASEASKLDAWIDFNKNGFFDQPGERLGSTSIQLKPGNNIVRFTVPRNTPTGQTFARFRVSSAGGLGPIGAAVDGEVEDYPISIVSGNQTIVSVQPKSAKVALTVKDDQLTVNSEADGTYVNLALTPGQCQTFGSGGLTGIAGVAIGVAADSSDNELAIDITQPLCTPLVIDFDGESGFDSVILAGRDQQLDLNDQQTNRLHNIELIDFRGTGPNTLNVSGAGVSRITDENHVLQVRCDSDDQILFETAWTVTAPTFINGQFMHILLNGLTKVDLQNSLAYRNPLEPLDVDHNAFVSPLDVLLVINLLNNPVAPYLGSLETPTFSSDLLDFLYLDVNGDNFVSAIDALWVINYINMNPGADGESPARSLRAQNDLIAYLPDYSSHTWHFASPKEKCDEHDEWQTTATFTDAPSLTRLAEAATGLAAIDLAAIDLAVAQLSSDVEPTDRGLPDDEGSRSCPGSSRSCLARSLSGLGRVMRSC